MPINSNIPGFMNLAELKTLESWAQIVPPHGIIAEIGSFMGRSSYTLASSAHPSVSVYCIDPWPIYRISKAMQQVMDSYDPNICYNFETFRKNTQECSNLVPMRGKSTQFKWPEEKKIDLLFIDAKHKSPHIENDIACWLPRLKENGILAGHDYLKDRYPDVCTAVSSISQKLKTPIQFFPGGSLWMIQLKQDLQTP